MLLKYHVLDFTLLLYRLKIQTTDFPNASVTKNLGSDAAVFSSAYICKQLSFLNILAFLIKIDK
jgi:hypothetical protein